MGTQSRSCPRSSWECSGHQVPLQTCVSLWPAGASAPFPLRWRPQHSAEPGPPFLIPKSVCGLHWHCSVFAGCGRSRHLSPARLCNEKEPNKAVPTPGGAHPS